MSYLPAINTLWDHASHPSKRAWSRSPSPEPAQHDANAQAGPSTQLAPARQAAVQRRLVRQSTRGDHLPMRTRSAEQARMLRALKGYPPIGSSADADQLSDLEESIEVGKYQMVRFGERYIVQIGRRRTMREEELSNEEDDGRRAAMSAVDAGLSIGPEGVLVPAAVEDASLPGGGDEDSGAGPFIGGHTGHAQAELNQRQIAEAERRARDAEAGANRAAAAAEAARSQAERQAAFQEEEDAVDLDGDVEDLDEGEDDVDFD
ncbi:hypothetical protein EX895_001842 [Sporisorium graminicola]|uniref:Uncharacterized protein n=1 Tax=Sporisorium graminicola TaxID=280036 RepID=A0A4U7KX35_9BASI|nr:hypothetical protein EX895_001842 [Sporisorium graminicola]TKY89311.1 hypothetical protein EX895_001842 [Sporisorium graminicola]